MWRGSTFGCGLFSVDLRDAKELPGPRGLQIGVTLDVLLTFLKSGDVSGHLKEV